MAPARRQLATGGRFALAVGVAAILACQEKGLETRLHVPSPSGWCKAYVLDYEHAHSQVILEFDGGKCGSGAVTALADHAPLYLRWLDATTLEVQHPSGVRMERNASGEVLQCGGPHRRVRVVLRPEQ
jgi:hypothetical protein